MKKRVICHTLSILFLLAACGPSKTYLVDIRYVPQAPPGVKFERAVVGLAAFLDKRDQEKEVGLRKKLDGSVDRYTTGRINVSESVRRAVRKFLLKNDVTLVDVEMWDLTARSVPEIDTDLVVGGEIHRFWSDAESSAGRTVIKTDMAMTIHLGKPRARKVFRQTVEMTTEKTELVFSQDKMEEAINEMLSEMIEDAFGKLTKQVKDENRALVARRKKKSCFPPRTNGLLRLPWAQGLEKVE